MPDAMETWSPVHIEVDAILAEYPDRSADELAAVFERLSASFDGDKSEAAAILAELPRRTEAQS